MRRAVPLVLLLAACESESPTAPSSTLAPLTSAPPRVVIDGPVASEVGFDVTFRWHLENPQPGEAYTFDVRLDKGAGACDGFIEQAFDAGHHDCLTVSLSPFRYTNAHVTYGVRARSSSGKVVCTGGRSFVVRPQLPAGDPCKTLQRRRSVRH